MTSRTRPTVRLTRGEPGRGRHCGGAVRPSLLVRSLLVDEPESLNGDVTYTPQEPQGASGQTGS